MQQLGTKANTDMIEIIFLVEEALDGGFVARALGQSIFTEADTLEGITEKVRDAVRCHFDILPNAS